jgi:DNA-binding CsgD family transcriptional regulator
MSDRLASAVERAACVCPGKPVTGAHLVVNRDPGWASLAFDLRVTALHACLVARCEAAREMLVDVLAVAPAQAPVDGAALLATLGLVAVFGGQPPSSVQIDLVARAEADAHSFALAAAHVVRAQRALADADPATARRETQAAAVLVDAASDRCLTACLELMPLLAWTEARSGLLRAAGRHGERGIRLAERSQQMHLLPFLLLGRAQLGSWDVTAHPSSSEPVADVRAPRSAPAPSPLAVLTRREREIACLASTGKKNKEIACALHLSPRTVEIHLTRIYRKLAVPSRAALARLLSRLDDCEGDPMPVAVR